MLLLGRPGVALDAEQWVPAGPGPSAWAHHETAVLAYGAALERLAEVPRVATWPAFSASVTERTSIGVRSRWSRRLVGRPLLKADRTTRTRSPTVETTLSAMLAGRQVVASPATATPCCPCCSQQEARTAALGPPHGQPVQSQLADLLSRDQLQPLLLELPPLRRAAFNVEGRVRRSSTRRQGSSFSTLKKLR